MGAHPRDRRRHPAAKFDACRKAGADEVVDASQGRVAEQLLDLTKGQGVDVVIDYVSATATLEAGARALGRSGRLVTLGGSGKPFQALGSTCSTRSRICSAAAMSRAAR